MEDEETDDAANSGSNSGEPIREANTATDKEDEHLVYDHTSFRKDKIRCRYNLYYSGPRVIIKEGAVIAKFDECASRVWAVLDA